MRGAYFLWSFFVLLSGITPAHAGSIAPEQGRDFGMEDHPRACGEHDTPLKQAKSCLGSPPRMRGACNKEQAACEAGRITPAHAGSMP